MTTNKKYKIISNIRDDVPFGDINWYSISFLTPSKLPITKYLDVLGFKVHNGYNTTEIATEDIRKIKDRNKNHDVYLSQMGKLYAWDDSTKTDSVEYDDQKLNEMEETRRIQMDKIKLMTEQFKNECKFKHNNLENSRIGTGRKRIQKKLYDKGLITKQEYELMQKEDKPTKEIREMASILDKNNIEMEECFSTDYLDENEPIALQYGCLSIFSPKHIGGLKTLCFKIRGMFQTMDELNNRINKLKELYPDDRMYIFEIGKWCPFSENDEIEHTILLKQLNYSMKCHLDNVQTESNEFEKRVNSKVASANQETQVNKRKNRKEKKKDKKDKGLQTEPVPSTFGDQEDDAAIQRIMNYLDNE